MGDGGDKPNEHCTREWKWSLVTLCTFVFKEKRGDGEMVQKLRTLEVFAESLSSAPRIHMG